MRRISVLRRRLLAGFGASALCAPLAALARAIVDAKVNAMFAPGMKRVGTFVDQGMYESCGEELIQ